MNKLIILQGGDDVKRQKNKQLFRWIAKLSKKKVIIIFPWTSDNEKKYEKVLERYFKSSGFREVLFASRKESRSKILEILKKYDVLYLPGGDPEILYETIKEKRLVKAIKDFRGIIIGNSAGAIVLTKGQWEKNKFYKGFGLINMYIKVHFDPKKDDMSKGKRETLYIKECEWIAIKK